MSKTLPPLPAPKIIRQLRSDETPLPPYLIYGYTADQMQAYASAAIANIVVPSGYCGSAYVSSKTEHTVTVEFETAEQAEAYIDGLAEAMKETP